MPWHAWGTDDSTIVADVTENRVSSRVFLNSSDYVAYPGTSPSTHKAGVILLLHSFECVLLMWPGLRVGRARAR